MIESLFASPALYATLAFFFDYPHDFLYPRLIARRTGTDIKSVLREIRKLETLGVVRARAVGRRRRYRVNREGRVARYRKGEMDHWAALLR